METTQADLKAEIAHSQTLQNKPTKGQRETPRPGRTAQDTLINDPKHGVTIRLYEDLTNLIVLSAKIQESPYAYLGQVEEITYKCIFSHMNTGEYRVAPSYICSNTLSQQVSHFCSHLCTNNRPLSRAIRLLVPKRKMIFNAWCDIPRWSWKRSRRNIYKSWTSSRIPLHSVMTKWNSS